MIKIPGTLSFAKIRELYQELEYSPAKIIDIQLPLSIEKLDFGLLFSYLQFFSTWLRNERSGKLHLPVATVDEAIQYLNDNEFVYPSIVLAWEKEIVNIRNQNIKSALKDPSKSYFNRMDFFKLKGTSVPIYCFDHDKSSRGLSKNFYDNKRELVNEDTLGFNLFRAFLKISSHNVSTSGASLIKNLDSFNAIVHELFMNTHEHAKTNELGYNLYPNIRAIQLKFHKKPLSKFIEQYSEFKGLLNYFKSSFSTNDIGDLYLLEISILDSGPGLVNRYKGIAEINLNINEDANIIKECLYRC